MSWADATWVHGGAAGGDRPRRSIIRAELKMYIYGYLNRVHRAAAGA